jgi:hypothetical protein
MANTKPVLKIFSLGHVLMTTEWKSILGDKYCHALPFDYLITENIEEASIIFWDGIISLKRRNLQQEVESLISRGKILLIIGESSTLFQNHKMIQYFQSPDSSTVYLNGWSVLPEEILDALDACYQKMIHV